MEAALQWNLGGWLGGQLGGTCWMLIAAALAFPHDPRVAGIVLALFAIPNLIGWRLWAARGRLSPLRATRAMVVVAAAFGVASVHVLDRAGLWEAIQIGGHASARMMYAAILAVAAALLALFGRLA